jgi:large subunit ribosomal protein L4
MVGGGVALGPKPRKYSQRTPKKMIALALRSALSDRALDNKVVVVDKWSFDAPSTKLASALLDQLGVDGKVMVVIDRTDEIAIKSFRNLTNVQVVTTNELNAYDVLCNDWLVFTQSSLPKTVEVAK